MIERKVFHQILKKYIDNLLKFPGTSLFKDLFLALSMTNNILWKGIFVLAK